MSLSRRLVLTGAALSALPAWAKKPVKTAAS